MKRLRSTNPLLFAAAFAILGATLLVATRAATTYKSIEPESENLSGAVSAQSGAEASGGEYVIFGSSVSGQPIATTEQSSITQYGLTINFDKDYPVGQFVNGDYFVVGSPTVSSVSPVWDGTDGVNGSMVNPHPKNHGFRGGGTPAYDSSLNVATQLPVQLSPGDSFLHSEGWRNDDPNAPSINSTYNVPRPAIKQVIVLSVLSEAPPKGSFRPPYIDGTEKILNTASLRWDKLADLSPVASTPSWSQIESQLGDGPWIEFIQGSISRYIQPSNNMSSYGREIARDANEAILKLLLDYPQQEKEETLIHIVQNGIDIWATVKYAYDNNLSFSVDGESYYGGFGGGHGTGRKWPVLFAGVMLEDQEILDAAANYGPAYWGEDGQTYFVEEFASLTSEADWLRESGGSWGARAWTRTTSSSQGIPGTLSYRTCCTALAWNGAALAARIMGVEEQWNHDAFFDYMDWYMDVDQLDHKQNGTGVATSGPRARTQFLADMWDTYRQNY